MFKNIFGNKASGGKTGFFRVEKKTLIEIEEMPGNGSIDACTGSLGVPPNHIHTVLIFNSAKIQCLGFKTLSKELVFVLAKNSETKISYSEVQKEISQIDWDSEYSSLEIEQILEDGVYMENFDLKFLQSVIDLKKDGDNIYKSEQLGLYLQFDNDILTSFTSSGFDDSVTKWLKDINPTMVRKMTEEAQQYHENDIDAMEEVNKQASSLRGIPDAVSNEFIPLHSKPNGNINFYNLLVTHYKNECTIDEFLFMNKGRFRTINKNTIEVGNFIYSFNNNGQLENIVTK